MDVLSEVLRVTNLTPHVLGARELVAPWGILIKAADRPVVHVVGRGSCWLHRHSGEPLRLNAGDVVLLPYGDTHALSSEREPHDLESLDQAAARTHEKLLVPRQGNVEPTLLQTIDYQCSKEGSHPLLALLPPLVRIPADSSGDGELQLLVRLLTHESTRGDAGVERAMRRLVDALFVYLLRAWIRTQPEGACGWLGALRDPQIGKALSLIHERPQQPWTVEALARAVAMSRAAFAKRFAQLVGEPPLAYITRWRMDIAAKLLRESREPVARIAGKVGYVSETAFAKAFRRRRQLAPGAYRYQRRNGAGAHAPAAQ